MSSWGDLIWQGPATDPSGPYQASNLRYQSTNTTNYLTYWQGYVQQGINASIGYGNLTLLDNQYSATTVCPDLGLTVVPGTPHDCDIDYNEQYLTPWGTLLITAYNLTQVDLTSVNGSKNGYVLDAQIHEIDIETSESIWKWSSLDYIPLNASQLPLTGLAENSSVAWDYVHINSVSTYDDDKLIVNARHTWDVFAVERASKDIVWNFNGISGGDWGIVPEESTFVSLTPKLMPNRKRFLTSFLSLGNTIPASMKSLMTLSYSQTLGTTTTPEPAAAMPVIRRHLLGENSACHSHLAKMFRLLH